MPHIKNNLSMWDRLSRFLKQSGKSAADSATSVLSYAYQQSEYESNIRPHRPDPEEIQVEEIDQEEFVREWGRTISNEAAFAGNANTGEGVRIDRRLPNFDRRLPNHDRRAGDGHDRRRGSIWSGTTPTPTVDKRSQPKK